MVKNIRSIGGDNARAREEIFSLLSENARATREQLCMSYRITEKQFEELLRETIAEWDAADEKDYTRRHFINVLRIKAQKINDANNRQRGIDRRRGYDTTATRTEDYEGPF